MNSSGNLFRVVLFGVLFLTALWFFEVRDIQLVVWQYRAQSYLQTEGRIESAQITTWVGKRYRVFYHAAFRYSYNVRDYSQGFEGRRYRYDGGPSDCAAIKQAVSAHPAGSTVTVYYNPHNPADALLAPGVAAQDLSRLFFMTPLTLIFWFMVLKAGRELDWPGKTKPVVEGINIQTDRMKTQVRFARYSAGRLGLMTAGGLSVLAGMVFWCNVIPDPASDGLFALLVILVIGTATFFWQRQRLATGVEDLLIDGGARTVTLPWTGRQGVRRVRTISEITAITVEQVPQRGRFGTVSLAYAPTLFLRDGSTAPLANVSQDRAEAFVTWLRGKLGISACVDRVEGGGEQ